ncbi:hypothetical protein [Shewanella violacea]|uniref:Uncharacterized protein n=1 Tax=Shewanella violacea (strain JCM 10179 / CIP 106290 / LMG 19151 / DSS12) TaxID=637905 RepID=D4ZH72_SHEVD|nr:hypothetical protein [Shewanella violacea]BAJ01021.1 conserved hypothetical protein [Shewanella violacea DSS12]
MFWFIGAFLVGSAVFLFAPKQASIQSEQASSRKSPGHISLFILPVIILAWLLFTLIDGHNSNYGAAAISLVLTSCAVAHPKFHKFIIPCASVTAVSLLAGIILAS